MIKIIKMDTSLHHITSCVVPIVNCNSRMGGKTNIKLVKDSDELVVPDSTTPPEKERMNFEIGEDVLLKHKDGRYYLGTVVDIDFIRERCFLRFGDNTQSWSGIKDLTKLSLPDEDNMCVVCKKSAPKDKHEITVCDKCGRGYHSKCHQPHISEEIITNGDSWVCKKCNDNCIVTRSNKELVSRKKEPVQTIRKLSTTPSEPTPKNLPTNKSELPYEPDILTWDSYHRVNMEQIYCYCGQAGEWFTQMLQCGRCKQWFHEKCVRCLKYPLYCGDRFYVFVCSTCNNGKEFLRRLEMKWVDLVHLMLFNLTAFNAKKYYDLDTVIIPYVNDNWHALQLPPKINNTSKTEIRETILNILTSNRNRFKCGREIKKRTTIWGLRVRLPPPAPCVTLPSVGPVTEAELKERWHGNKRLQFLPQNDKSEDVKPSPANMVVPVDPTMLDLMMGTHYFTQSDSESPCSSPETDEKIGVEPNFESTMAQTRSSFEGGGFVKRSVPFPTKYNPDNLRRKKLISGKRDKTLLRRQKRKFSIKKSDTEKTFTRKLRYRRSHALVNESNEDESVVNKSDVSFPPTPPTSVSAPPTPPATNSNPPQSTLSEASSDGISNTDPKFRPICDPFSIDSSRSSSLSKSNICKNSEFDVSQTNISLESNTPCDTSGDETSSKSTLDLIIPPPKDFKGKNNPFHSLPKDSSNKREKSPEISSTKSVSLPLSLNPVMPVVRTLKRQLSEKDIFIGPNGEVKRRRFRRNRLQKQHAQTVVSKTATVVPARNLRSNVQPITNCVDYALNGRRLRQRQDKGAEAAGTSTSKSSGSVPSSPVKSETNIDDLKSSVNIYFGAATRIASGEKFTIRASRIGPEGKLQYLIEWEGHDQSVS